MLNPGLSITILIDDVQSLMSGVQVETMIKIKSGMLVLKDVASSSWVQAHIGQWEEETVFLRSDHKWTHIYFM